MARFSKRISLLAVILGLCLDWTGAKVTRRKAESDGAACDSPVYVDPGYHKMQMVDDEKPVVRPEELGSEHWNTIAQKELTSSLNLLRNINNGRAKNVILFLGDGMGITTLTAARILKGQQNGLAGEESSLVFERFPHVGLAKTYNVDHQVPDSAGTGTAFVTGVKTNSGTLGVTAAVERSNCTASKDKRHHVSSYLEWAIKERGRSAGIVTTTRITHATPASTYAHTSNRDWECDTFTGFWEGTAPFDPECDDIATELVRKEPGNLFQVIFGGGRHCFDGNAPTEDLDKKGSCVRNGSSSNLIDEWQAKMSADKRKFKYVQDKAELKGINAAEVDYALGLFANNHIPYVYERKIDGPAKERFPTLVEMTEKAIEILSKNENGFALMVEGGRIDHAHHDTMFNAAFQEVIEFDDAVQKALDMTDPKETLIIVTADHSHTLSFGGYPLRGAPVYGYGGLDDSTPTRKKYLTMAYANGKEYDYANIKERPEPNIDESVKPDFKPWTPVKMNSETHGGEDVAIYATGPMAHLFHGLHEQNYIAHVIGYATCTGVNQDHCTGSASLPSIHSFFAVFMISCIHFAFNAIFH